MKFRVDRSLFWQRFQTVVATVPLRTTFPILTNILLETEDDHLLLAATDLDISISTRIPVEVSEKGGITLPGRKLGEIIRELPNLPISFVLSENVVTIECERGVFKLSGVERDEYPELPEVDKSKSLSLNIEKLNRAIEKTSFAASSDEMKPALSGVLWQMSGKEMRMVATDGHRLALLKLKGLLRKSFSANVNVPPRALNQLVKLTGEGGDVEVRFEESRVGFYLNGSTITARLVEGEFPDYEQVIPKDNDKTARVGRDALVAALRRVAVFANPDTHLVKFAFEGDALHLYAVTPELGEAHEEIPCDYQGEKIEIGYNASYFLAILERVDSEEVTITLKDPLSAGTVLPSEQRQGEELLYLLMPIRMAE